MFTSAGRAGRAPTLTVIDEQGEEREWVRQGCWGEREGGRKSVKKAGYLPSLGERESPSGGGGGSRWVRRGEERLEFIDKKGERREGETMFGIEREQTIICID